MDLMKRQEKIKGEKSVYRSTKTTTTNIDSYSNYEKYMTIANLNMYANSPVSFSHSRSLSISQHRTDEWFQIRNWMNKDNRTHPKILKCKANRI